MGNTAARPEALSKPYVALPRLLATASLALALGLGIAGCHKTDNAETATDPSNVNNAPAAGGNCPANEVLMSDGSCQNAATAMAQPAAGAPQANAMAAPRRSYGAANESQQPEYRQNAQPEQPSTQPATAQQAYSGQSDQSGQDDDMNPADYDTGSAYDTQTYNQDAYNQGYQQGYEQGIQATQPPPPLPVYAQPLCPAPGYLWTPGYWGYSPTGYYWVPGAWTPAPYTGALWTPGWWGFLGGLFHWHHGYWGPHIGFYGGVPYGYGYTGDGYHGGYWSGRNFYYNRSVTNVNVTNITNIYNRTVINNVVSNRVSYNGGPGGLAIRPTPSQFAAMREVHVNPLPAQMQHQQLAMQSRTQYAHLNGGRPAMLVAAHPLAASPVRAIPALVNPGVHGATRPTGLYMRPAPVEGQPARPALTQRQALKSRPVEGVRPTNAPVAVHPSDGEGSRPSLPARSEGPLEQNHADFHHGQSASPWRPHTEPAPRENPRPTDHPRQTYDPPRQRPETQPVPNRHDDSSQPRYEAPRQPAAPQYYQRPRPAVSLPETDHKGQYRPEQNRPEQFREEQPHETHPAPQEHPHR